MTHQFHAPHKKLFSNSVYATFLLASLVIHWRFLATIFLVQNETIIAHHGMTKDAYLKSLLFSKEEPVTSVILLVLPFLGTWFILFVIQPKVILPLLRKDKEYEIEKEIIDFHKDQKILEERIKKAAVELREAELHTRALKKQSEVAEADPSIKWERSFLKFKNSPYYETFISLVKEFYSGNAEIFDGGLASYLDSIGVIHINATRPQEIQEFSEKGKYFIRRINEFDSIS